MTLSVPRLGVNIDHVATLRQARGVSYPSPLKAALLAEEAGADQIVCHLREDRRHIQDQDLIDLRRHLKTRLNLEMAATDEMIQIATRIGPDLVTLVPEKRQELTTEGGLNLKSNFNLLRQKIKILHSAKIPVSLFIHPELEDLQRSVELEAVGVEIHTGGYANATTPQKSDPLYQQILKTAIEGTKMNLKVFAGHGLHTQNILPLLKIKQIEEYNIGHSIIARAVLVGIKQSVQEMKEVLLMSV